MVYNKFGLPHDFEDVKTETATEAVCTFCKLRGKYVSLALIEFEDDVLEEDIFNCY